MSDRLRVVVCGYVVRGPLGGLAWHHLQYVIGLHRMGHDVVFAEDSDDYESCYDPSRNVVDSDPTYGLAFTGDAFDRLGLGDRWAYYDAHRSSWHGPLAARGPRLFAGADLLLNLSGVNPPRPWWDGAGRRALVDTDPVFTQLRHLHDETAAAAARTHTAFFTFGESTGGPDCRTPDDGLPWRPTRQPVVLDCWPVTPAPPSAPWTTVMQWDSYAERKHAGVVYGMKSRSFDLVVDVPLRRPGDRFEIALGSAGAPRQQLREQGWAVVDPLERTRDPWAYQQYVQGSRGEFSVAKHGYVLGRTGWFSERTAGYLASGRPAIVQDTGFSRILPTGEGLLAFETGEEAVDAVDRVNADHERHARAARALAEDLFDHRAVLGRLLEDALSD